MDALGIVELVMNGKVLNAKGSFTYNLGNYKNEVVIGADRIHGHTQKPQAAYIEGNITDSSDLDVAELTSVKNATIYLKLANGKKIAIYNAIFTGDGNVTSEEGEIAVRWDGSRGEEIK